MVWPGGRSWPVSTSRRSRCWGTWLPYGDTVFNSRQVSTLLAEVPRLPSGVATDECARELLELGQKVLEGLHLYLWFLGD